MARVQDVFTATKVLALMIIVVAGMVWLGFGHTANLDGAMRNTNSSPGSIALAFYR